MASLPFLVQGTRSSFLANLGYKCLTSPASKSHLNSSPFLLQRCTYSIETVAHGGEYHENTVESKLKTLGHVTRVLPTPFDTLQVVKELQKAGFAPGQAEGLSQVLVSVLQLNSQHVAQNQATLRDLDLLELKLKGEIDSTRSDLVLLEKSTVAQLSSENQALSSQIQKLRGMLKEEMGKMQGGIQLDLNLEKSRNKEAATESRQLIKDTGNRIDTEVAKLKTQMESQKLEMVKYLTGGMISVITVGLSIVLGVWRLTK